GITSNEVVNSAVLRTIAPTEQYFDSERWMALATASLLTFVPVMMCQILTFVKTCGGSEAWSASTRTSYAVTFWRFLRRMLITSNAVQPASAAATSSIGF